MKRALAGIALLIMITGAIYFFRSSSKYQYEMTICSMFKNEAPWLKEWVVYHHDVLGFEHFYLYNNDSTDNYMEVLRPFIDKGIVEIIDWSSKDPSHLNKEFPSVSVAGQVAYQLGAFNDCLHFRALGKAKWVAIIDIDEFFVPSEGASSLRSFLRDCDKKNIGSIRFVWKIFGTSHVKDLQAGELLTEKMVLRAPDDPTSWWYTLWKSMHRPEAVVYCHNHEAAKLHSDFLMKVASQKKFRINHYWARTEEHCFNKRGNRDPKEYGLTGTLDALNSVEDKTIEQYLPKLKRSLTLLNNSLVKDKYDIAHQAAPE